MARGGKEKRLQKAIGALKDVTTVNLARTDGDYKQLHIAIMKATSQVERLANEKHIRAIFAAISSTRPEFDVACRIFALARRLEMTNSWVVALKTLIVIHRAIREVQQTVQHKFINYCGSSSIVLNTTRFKDDSSINARDYSAWIRSYALCLEERIHCYRLLGYDIVMETPIIEDLGSYELILQLHDLQRLLFRVLRCLPQGAATHNLLIQPILSLVVSEGIKIYNALSAGIVRLISKSIRMSRTNALKALNICRRAVHLAGRFLELLEICKSLDVGVIEGSIKMELSRASLKALEDHVRGADLPRRQLWMAPTLSVLCVQLAQMPQQVIGFSHRSVTLKTIKLVDWIIFFLTSVMMIMKTPTISTMLPPVQKKNQEVKTFSRIQ